MGLRHDSAARHRVRVIAPATFSHLLRPRTAHRGTARGGARAVRHADLQARASTAAAPRLFTRRGAPPRGGGTHSSRCCSGGRSRVGRAASARRGATLQLIAPLGNGFYAGDAGHAAGGAGGGRHWPAAVAVRRRAHGRGRCAVRPLLGATTAAELAARRPLSRRRRRPPRAGHRRRQRGEHGSGGRGARASLDAGTAYARVLAAAPTRCCAPPPAIARRAASDAELSLRSDGVRRRRLLGCVVELADGHFVPSCKDGPVFRAAISPRGGRNERRPGDPRRPLALAQPGDGAFRYVRLRPRPRRVFRPSQLGAVVSRRASPRPGIGNPPPASSRPRPGMINAIGLQNIGVEAFCRDGLPELCRRGATVAVQRVASGSRSTSR